jgi:hypothetical protein
MTTTTSGTGPDPAALPGPPPFTPLNADDVTPEELPPGAWLSVHVHHARNREHMLAECVAPLFERLRAEGLVDGCYFLRHYLEGAHLRLRLHPTPGSIPEIRRILEPAVEDYFRRVPSNYDPDNDLTDAQYKQRFLMEFSEAQWDERYGTGATHMPRRPYDSLAYVKYEPEYDRYGGPEGVELAEWHADRSAATVIDLVRSTKTWSGSVRLGLGLQLTATLAFAVLGDEARTVAYLDRRMHDWEKLFSERYDEYAAAYERMAPSLARRVDDLRAGVLAGETERLAGFVRRWAEHAAELRERIEDAAGRGALVFPVADGSGERRAVGAETAKAALLPNYSHMTANRLGVTNGSEDYLAYLLRRTLERAGSAAG